jgi:hypothetical protein
LTSFIGRRYNKETLLLIGSVHNEVGKVIKIPLSTPSDASKERNACQNMLV